MVKNALLGEIKQPFAGYMEPFVASQHENPVKPAWISTI